MCPAQAASRVAVVEHRSAAEREHAVVLGQRARRRPRARARGSAPHRRSTKMSEIVRRRRASTSASVSRTATPSRSASSAGHRRSCRSPSGRPARVMGGSPVPRARPGSRRTLRRVSLTESPPNFSSTASASTSATIASATMPAPGTAHTSERWWCATAASPVATSTVAQRPRHGRDRLHRGPHPQHLAGASCRPRCRPSAPTYAGCRRRRARSRRGPASPGVAASAKPSPTSTPLIAWMPISAPASRRVEPAVPVHVRAEARRQAVHDHLDDAAEGVAVLVGLVDLGDHRGRRVGVEAAHRVVVERGPRRRGRAQRRRARARRRARPRATRSGRPAPARGSAGDPARARRGRRSRGREARSRTGRASSKPYFCMPDQVGVPGTRPGQGRVAGQRLERRPGRPGRPTSPSPTWATRCCRPGWRPGRPGSARGGRRR